MMNDLELLSNLVPQSTFYFFTPTKIHSSSLCLLKTHPHTGTPPPPEVSAGHQLYNRIDSGRIRILLLGLPQSKKEYTHTHTHIHGGSALGYCVGVLIVAGFTVSNVNVHHVTFWANVSFSSHFISSWNEIKQALQWKSPVYFILF